MRGAVKGYVLGWDRAQVSYCRECFFSPCESNRDKNRANNLEQIRLQLPSLSADRGSGNSIIDNRENVKREGDRKYSSSEKKTDARSKEELGKTIIIRLSEAQLNRTYRLKESKASFWGKRERRRIEARKMGGCT